MINTLHSTSSSTFIDCLSEIHTNKHCISSVTCPRAVDGNETFSWKHYSFVLGITLFYTTLHYSNLYSLQLLRNTTLHYTTPHQTTHHTTPHQTTPNQTKPRHHTTLHFKAPFLSSSFAFLCHVTCYNFGSVLFYFNCLPQFFTESHHTDLSLFDWKCPPQIPFLLLIINRSLNPENTPPNSPHNHA